MSSQLKINARITQIELAGKANGYSNNTITRMLNEYRKAMAGKSRVMAVKAFSSECLGGEKPLATAIRECSDPGCPLYPYRPYRMAVDAQESEGNECTLSGVIAP